MSHLLLIPADNPASASWYPRLLQSQPFGLPAYLLDDKGWRLFIHLVGLFGNSLAGNLFALTVELDYRRQHPAGIAFPSLGKEILLQTMDKAG